MIDAVGVIGGKVGTRVLAELLPIPGKGAPMMNFLVQAGSAIAVGTVAQMMVSPQVARMVVAGGLATPIESFLRGMPVIGPMLGDDFLELGDADPFLPVGEYPEAVQVGEYDGLTEGAYGVGDADPFLPVGEYAYSETFTCRRTTWLEDSEHGLTQCRVRHFANVPPRQLAMHRKPSGISSTTRSCFPLLA
jgi:hypothetical protein